MTIEGTNLGHRRDHVTSVTVASVRCDVTQYNVSTTSVTSTVYHVCRDRCHDVTLLR